MTQVSYQYARRRRHQKVPNPFAYSYDIKDGIYRPNNYSIHTIEEYLEVYYPHLLGEFRAYRHEPHDEYNTPYQELDLCLWWDSTPSFSKVWVEVYNRLVTEAGRPNLIR